jgi:hypothetical protein
MIVGDTNPSTLATNLHFVYHPWPQIKIESKLQTRSIPCASDIIRESTGLLEFSGERSTISLAIRNPKREAGQMKIGFLHSFNKKLCAGIEMLTAWTECTQSQFNVALAGRLVH